MGHLILLRRPLARGPRRPDLATSYATSGRTRTTGCGCGPPTCIAGYADNPHELEARRAARPALTPARQASAACCGGPAVKSSASAATSIAERRARRGRPGATPASSRWRWSPGSAASAGDRGELRLAAERGGVRRARVEQLVEDRRAPAGARRARGRGSSARMPSREARKRFSSSTSGRHAISVVDVAARRLEPHEALDERGQRRVVGRARLRVHDPHLDRPELAAAAARPTTGTSARGTRRSAAARRSPRRSRRSRRTARGMPTRGNVPNTGTRAAASPVSRPCQNGELADEREQQRHVHAHAAQRAHRRLRVGHARRGRAARTSARAGRARAWSRRSTGSARPGRPRSSLHCANGCVPGDGGAQLERGEVVGEPGAQVGELAGRGARRSRAGRVASSSAEPWVSAAAWSATSRESAGSTSSIREASDQSRGSSSMTSSSRPTVHGASAASGFQRAQSGSSVIRRPTCPSPRRSATS